YNSGKIRYSFANNETKNIDFTEEIKNTKKFVADKIFDRINNNWGSVRNTLDEIYFVGGGSILYNAELQEKFGNRLKEIDNRDRKSTRLNSSHVSISYAVFCLKKK